MQPNSPKKFFDITPPTPSATSRPVIVNNQGVTDPTINKIEVNEAPRQASQLPQFKPLTSIQPVAPAPSVIPVQPPAPAQSAPITYSAPLSPTPPAELPKFGAMQSKIDAHPLFSGQNDVVPKAKSTFLKKLLWITSILLVIAAGVYAAIDSGAIDTNINLPFHIFSQSASAFERI